MESDPSEEDEPESANRRRFLKALGAVGVVGLAGCGGDGDDTDEPTETTGDMGTTESPETAEPPETTETPEPTGQTPTETGTPECQLGDEAESLISFDGVSDGALNVSPNADTISGVIQNPYLFDIQSGEVTLEPPSDEWEISNPSGNTFDTLESQTDQEVEWEVSVPSVAGEEFELTTSSTYEAPNCDEPADVQHTQAVFVDPYIGQEFQQLATAPEYVDEWDDGDSPGDPGSGGPTANGVEVDLDLSDWADAVNFQLRFGDYWSGDGFGARLQFVDIIADGETIHSVTPGTETEEAYLVENNGSQIGGTGLRFADGGSSWTYQFGVPEGTEELTAFIVIDNHFLVEGREGLERGDGVTTDPLVGNARIAHMSPDAPNVDVYVDGDAVIEDVAFGDTSDYLEVPAGDRQVEITAAGDASTTVFDGTVNVTANTDFTVVAAGETSEDADQPFEVLTLRDNNAAVSDGIARLRALHVSPDAPAVDITAAGGDDVLFDGVAFGESGYTTVEANDYTVQIRDDTESNDGEVVADSDVSLNGGTVYTAFAAGYLNPDEAPADTPFDLIVAQDSGG
jgi:hypothetical protein